MSTETTAYQDCLAELEKDIKAIKQVFENQESGKSINFLTKHILTRMQANLAAAELCDPHEYYQPRLELKDMAIRLCVRQLASAKLILGQVHADSADEMVVDVAEAKMWLDTLEEVLPKEEYQAVLEKEKALASFLGR